MTNLNRRTFLGGLAASALIVPLAACGNDTDPGTAGSPAATGGGVSLWCLSSCDGWSWLVVGPVAEHGVEDIDASSG